VAKDCTITAINGCLSGMTVPPNEAAGLDQLCTLVCLCLDIKRFFASVQKLCFFVFVFTMLVK